MTKEITTVLVFVGIIVGLIVGVLVYLHHERQKNDTELSLWAKACVAQGGVPNIIVGCINKDALIPINDFQ